MDNDFLKNLDSSQVRELVDSMYPLEYSKGSYVIREGEAGRYIIGTLSCSTLYVCMSSLNLQKKLPLTMIDLHVNSKFLFSTDLLFL